MVTQSDNAASTIQDPRWAMLARRDPKADGKFVYSVRTTGIYCRPSCPSRLAKAEHIAFHATPAEAERAGFRACKRCRPDQLSAQTLKANLIADLCRFIEAADHIPSLAELAQRSGLSPHYMHRTFKAVTGLTPRAYAAATRANRLRAELESGASVTQAIYDAGYSSSSRFYDESDGVLGMTPSSYRAAGAGALIRFAVGECSLGAILVAQSNRGICAISMGDDPALLVRDLQDTFAAADLRGADAAFERLVATVVGFVECPKLGLDLPLDIRGTAFQRRVWAALKDIPPGATLTYTQVAQRIGAPKAARAVARACAENSLAVAIPCHRVVRTDGSLSGYRWGVERKRTLIEREARQ